MGYKLLLLINLNIFLIKLSVISCAVLEFSSESGTGNLNEDAIWSHEMYWADDVYTGRHFDEVVSSFKGDQRIVNRNTILVFYDDRCFSDLAKLGVNRSKLPGYHYVNYMKYNVRSTPRHIWYPLEGVDNLVERYLDGKAELTKPTVLLFKAGNALTEYIEFPVEVFTLSEDPDEFSLWVWDQMKVEVLLTNDLDDEITVKIYDGPAIADQIVKTDRRLVLHTYVSCKVTVVMEDTLVHAFMVEAGMQESTRVIDRESKYEFMVSSEAKWLQDKAEQFNNYNRIRYSYIQFIADGYLRLFKQSLLVEKYTDYGFSVLHIPADLHKSIKNVYSANEMYRQKRCIMPDGSHSGGDVECTTVPIALQYKIDIAEFLRPQLEEWCGGVELEMTHIYGINEFWDNSVILQNIGKVTDHVISVELIIAKELNGKADWELEIFDNKGRITYTHLDVGMMIFYESSSVSIKRPKPFQGRSYVSLVAHFRPKVGWPWRLAVEDSYLSDGHTADNLKVLNTPATLRAELSGPPKSPGTAHSHSGEL